MVMDLIHNSALDKAAQWYRRQQQSRVQMEEIEFQQFKNGESAEETEMAAVTARLVNEAKFEAIVKQK